MRQRTTTRPATGPAQRGSWRRPIIVSLAACTALCLLVPRPGYGDPGGSGVPDPGVLPVASAPFQPGSTNNGVPSAAAPAAGPLATQVQALSDEMEAVGEQLKSVSIQAQQAHDATISTYLAWQQAAN